ncbi:uncharacterized protein LOC122506396 [Leptopilina heterotoma]|uniref:uncharacterized protein LOC122502555 n=1 Tax=Leptopilina heterotoma TaxID=63436 RepID=UPI001CA83AF9|nr:uncharacterized protein LOC122502555 [Leptopilina heterotoma]XP_043474472.1 uncharacterized protein LOC122506396 [Leptopilina heterotoma]
MKPCNNNMFHKEKEYLHQIAKASEAIRRKHRMLKLGKEEVENVLTETFKPIVQPLQKIINLTDTEYENVKIEKKEQKIDDSINYETEKSLDDDKISNKFLYLLNHNRKQCLDSTYGVRKLSDGSLMIGDSQITLEDQHVKIGNKRYLQTLGLLELLFKSKPTTSLISEDDERNYKEILIATNAHKKKYSSSESIRMDKSYKYLNFISQFFPRTPTKQPSVSGSSLPKFMITNKNFQREYIYWDDPNELVDRLRLLMASQAAGNPSHNNEIMSIIEELREAKIIY